MNREEGKKQQVEDTGRRQQPVSQDNANREEDSDQHSYPGKLDHVEGSMNNGETGGGINLKEE